MNSTGPTWAVQQAAADRYAFWLDAGSRLGLLLLLLGFAAYLSGWVEPLVPLEQLPGLWSLPVATFLERTGTPNGWGWLALAGKADLFNLVGIAVLAGCSLPALLSLVPLYLQRGDRVYAAICTLVAAVVVLAACGILTGGH